MPRRNVMTAALRSWVLVRLCCGGGDGLLCSASAMGF
jgi:hypothetical protein